MKKPSLYGRLLAGLGLALGLLLGGASAARAQSPVTVSPTFFTDTTPITITFDATLGAGGLASYADSVFIYTGVITNLSTSPSNWRFVANTTGFGRPTKAEYMTPLGNHKYSISFTPRNFYPGLAASTEVVQKLAMVFRGRGGSPEGKGLGNSDIFVDVTQNSATLQAAISSPTGSGGNPAVVAAGTPVTLTGAASASATLTFTVNGTQVFQTTGTTISTSYTFTQPGPNTVVLTANNASGAASATTTVLVPPTPTVAALPAGANADGVTYLNGGTSVILSLTAPNKSFVYVLGDFNNWQITSAGLLSKTSTVNTDPATGRWWVQVNGLVPGTEYAYQFLVDGNLRVADPYCEKILDPGNDQYINAGGYTVYPGLKAYPTGLTTGNVSVLQTNQTPYVWTTTNFVRPARTSLVVYELLLRDFVGRHDYKTLTDTLKYLQRLGVNAIELMPPSEFEGNDSWGYNPSFYFAPDKYYGTKDAFKQFIDECHRRGIAVIMDMVLNHSCGASPMVQLYFDGSTGKPSASSPWYNQDAKHPANVCYDFNHESQYTKYFTKNVMKHWLTNYHVDGYRFDLSKGFTQTNSGTGEDQTTYDNWAKFDQSRINIWQDYYNTMVATDPTMYPILEHFAENTEDAALSNIGLMLWGNMNYNYNEATMGYTNTNLSYGYYGGQGGRGWSQPNLVTYMESHDEERLQFKNVAYGNASGSYSTKDPATGLRRNELAAAFFFSQPGPRMIWQFGELGYDYSINYCANNGTINNSCRTSAKPVRWDFYQDANRRHLFDTYRALIALRKQPVFAAPTSYTQNLAGVIKTIAIADANLSVVTVGNFGVVANSVTVPFPQGGTWYNYLTGQQLNVSTTSPTLLPLQPGEYTVYTNKKIAVPAGTTLAARAPESTAFRLSLAPNPACGTTTIAYELPAAATATIVVQNLLGQPVRQLTPARQAAGAQTQALPLTNLAPGVYLVRLQADGLTQTARLLVE